MAVPANPIASLREGRPVLPGSPSSPSAAGTTAVTGQGLVAYWLSGAIVVLLGAAAGAGLFVPGFYRDSPAITAMDRGSDLVTLALIAPALAVSMLLSWRGSVRARIVWLGLLAYVIYYYLIYAYGVRFNPLFLGYVALLSMALWAAGLLLAHFDLAALAPRFSPWLPRRTISVYLIVVAAMFFLVWMADIVPAMFGAPAAPNPNGAPGPGNPVEVNDLALALPLMVLAGYKLWRREAWGYLLAGILLVLFTAIAAVLLPSPWFQYLAGQTIEWGQYPIGVVMGGVGLVLTALYLRSLRPDPQAAS